MRLRRGALSLALALAGTASEAATPLQSYARRTAPAASAVPGEVVVSFRPGATDDDRARVLRLAGGRAARRGFSGERVLLTLDAGFGVEEAMARLATMPEVAQAAPNARFHASQARPGTFRPNDRLYAAQWNLAMIDAERTWGIQKGGAGVVVAVLDTGVAFEDFGPFRRAPDWGGTRFLPGFDFVNADAHPNDDEYHGTHIASTIAEATDNQEGVAGIAFGCAILPVKVLDRNGDGTGFDVADGIDFAVANGAKVVNLSLGSPNDDPFVHQAVDRAVAAGVTVVAAAGNAGRQGVEYPAALPNVIGVGAVDRRKELAEYSNFGPALDVVAPGGDVFRDDDSDGRPDAIYQQMPDRDALAAGRYDVFGYFGLDGTSSATAHVSALAALLYSQGITEPAAVQAAIERSAEDLGAAGRDDRFGHGLIRPSVALSGLGLAR